MFGNSVDPDGKQRETTKMVPVSPYGCAKLFAYSIVRNYRVAYKLFASNGILFNHESPRRASNFVTSKIIKNAVLISQGKLDKLELGNLDSQRDWGHSKDYVRAMRLICSIRNRTISSFPPVKPTPSASSAKSSSRSWVWITKNMWCRTPNICARKSCVTSAATVPKRNKCCIGLRPIASTP